MAGGGNLIMISRSFRDACNFVGPAVIFPGRVSALRLHHASGRLCIVNVHLEPKLAPEGKRAVLLLCEYLRDHIPSYHVVLAGDFNFDRDRIQLRGSFEPRDRWYDRQTENDLFDLFPEFAEVHQRECTRTTGSTLNDAALLDLTASSPTSPTTSYRSSTSQPIFPSIR